MQDRAKIIRIITISIVIFIFLLAVTLIVNLIKITGLNNRKAELSRKLSAINAQIEMNDEQIAYMATDEYVDQYAREYLGLIGNGEDPFVAE